MIGFLFGKYMGMDEGDLLVDVGGVGYSVLVPSRIAMGLSIGEDVRLHIHTNLRENALELFGFANLWEKKVFQMLTSVSGVGPRTAMSILGGLEPETLLSAIVREDRATLNSVSGVGKKTAERLILELSEKARKLLAERPAEARGQQAQAVATDKTAKRFDKSKIPAQGASASPTNGVDIADLWNEAIAALVNLGYRETDAIAAIRMASAKAEQAGAAMSLEKLIMSSLQLMSRGMG